MSVTVRIPTTLRPLSGGVSTVSVEGATLGEVLANLEAVHPGFKDRLFDDNGGLRRFVNLLWQMMTCVTCRVWRLRCPQVKP